MITSTLIFIVTTIIILTMSSPFSSCPRGYWFLIPALLLSFRVDYSKFLSLFQTLELPFYLHLLVFLSSFGWIIIHNQHHFMVNKSSRRCNYFSVIVVIVYRAVSALCERLCMYRSCSTILSQLITSPHHSQPRNISDRLEYRSDYCYHYYDSHHDPTCFSPSTFLLF